MFRSLYYSCLPHVEQASSSQPLRIDSPRLGTKLALWGWAVDEVTCQNELKFRRRRPRHLPERTQLPAPPSVYSAKRTQFPGDHSARAVSQNEPNFREPGDPRRFPERTQFRAPPAGHFAKRTQFRDPATRGVSPGTNPIPRDASTMLFPERTQSREPATEAFPRTNPIKSTARSIGSTPRTKRIRRRILHWRNERTMEPPGGIVSTMGGTSGVPIESWDGHPGYFRVRLSEPEAGAGCRRGRTCQPWGLAAMFDSNSSLATQSPFESLVSSVL